MVSTMVDEVTRRTYANSVKKKIGTTSLALDRAFIFVHLETLNPENA